MGTNFIEKKYVRDIGKSVKISVTIWELDLPKFKCIFTSFERVRAMLELTSDLLLLLAETKYKIESIYK